MDKIGIAFSDAGQYFPLAKTELVGNPRAQEMQGIVRSDVLSQYDLKPGVKTVLIFGGSQGALKINQAVVNALPILAKKNYQCYMLQVKDITIKLKKKSGCPRMHL